MSAKRTKEVSLLKGAVNRGIITATNRDKSLHDLIEKKGNMNENGELDPADAPATP